MPGKLVVYKEASDGKGVTDLFVSQTAPTYLKQRVARIRQRIGEQKAKKEAEAQQGKRVPKSYDDSYDFSQRKPPQTQKRVPKSYEAIYDYTQ